MSARRRSSLGQWGETEALRYLISRGLLPVTRNYRCPYGEIDLIVREGETLVFVEVKLRRSERFGSAAESIDRRKMERLLKAADHYLLHHPHPGPVRIDTLLIEQRKGRLHLSWLKNVSL